MGNIHIGKEITVVNVQELGDPYSGIKAMADELKQSLGDLNDTVCQIEGTLLSGLMNDIGIADEEVSQFNVTLTEANTDFKKFLFKINEFKLHPVEITLPPPQFYYVSGDGQGGISVSALGKSASPVDILSGASTGRDLLHGLAGKESEGMAGELLGIGTDGLGFLLGGALSLNADKGSTGTIESDIQNRLSGQESDKERLELERKNIENLATMQGKSWWENMKDSFAGTWNLLSGNSHDQDMRLDKEDREKKEFILENDANIPDKDKLTLYNQLEGQKEFPLPNWVDTTSENDLKGWIKSDKASIADDLSPNWKGGLGLFDTSLNPDDHIITELRMKILAEEQALEKLNAGKAGTHAPADNAQNLHHTSSHGRYSSSLGDIRANSIHANSLYINSMHSSASFSNGNTSSPGGGTASISINATPSASDVGGGVKSGGGGNVYFSYQPNHTINNHSAISTKIIHDEVVAVLTSAVADAKIGTDIH